jgi:hypothetical protein
LKSARPARSASALDWLRGDPSFAHLSEQARTLDALTEVVRSSLPGLPVTVIAYDNGRLVVGAAHAAVAARIRQVEPSLIAALTRAGWAVSAIRFKPQWQAPAKTAARPNKPVPDAAALAHVSALSDRVAHTGLRDALKRLAARHGG